MRVELIKSKRTFGDFGTVFHLLVNGTPIQAFTNMDLALKASVTWMSQTQREWYEGYAKIVHIEKLLSYGDLYKTVENLGKIEDILFERWKGKQVNNNADDPTLREIFDAMDLLDAI